jgi:hypothetical protein
MDHMKLEHAEANFLLAKQCPLCKETKDDSEQHALLVDLAKHLEEVSLLALPANIDKDDTDTSDEEVNDDVTLETRAKDYVAFTGATASHLAHETPTFGPNFDKLEDPKGYALKPLYHQTYQRPQHLKLLCSLCNDYPDGFRGEHELQQHTNRAHPTHRKTWICVDASNNGFLANCKACRTQKRYGAYYNAAAQ